MSRDFMLVLGGGVVSLVTTFVVLFVTDWVYRRDQIRQSAKAEPSEQIESLLTEKENIVS